MKKIFLLMFFLHSLSVMSQSTVIIGTKDTTNGLFDYPCPIQGFYFSTRAQHLYTAAELNVAGITSGSYITEIGWVVDPYPIGAHVTEAYSISLLNTNVTDLNMGTWEPGATVVYGPEDYYYPYLYGGNILFPALPFLYTGGNLIVEICGGDGLGSAFQNPPCHLTTNLPFVSTHQWREDYGPGCGTAYLTNTGDSTTRPVLALTFMPGNLEAPTIAGTVYYDVNQNGIRDGGEIGVPNRQVLLNPGGIYGITNQDGHYNFYLDTGSYNVSWISSAPWVQTSTPLTFPIHLLPNSFNNDFGIWAPDTLAVYSQLVGFVPGIMRCNRPGLTFIHLINSGLVQENGSLTLIHSPNLPFNVNTSTPGYTISGDTILWTYNNLWPCQALDFHGNFDNGPAGDTVTVAYIDSVFDDALNLQNVYSNTSTFVLSCSFDPNDKAVNPPGETSAHYTLMDQELQYTIRFQNTGNDTAFDVRILDTLDANLNLSTLQIIASSHPVTLQMTSGGVLQFSFLNIMLPDSVVDEPGSHGYVVYKISHQNGIAEGTTIYNTAHIIFDMNAPVVTNTTYNNFVSSIPTSIAENSLSTGGYIYPNPTNNQAWIILNGENKDKHRIDVYNSLGKKIFSSGFSGTKYLLKEKITPGIYFVSVSDEDGKPIYSSHFIQE